MIILTPKIKERVSDSVRTGSLPTTHLGPHPCHLGRTAQPQDVWTASNTKSSRHVSSRRRRAAGDRFGASPLPLLTRDDSEEFQTTAWCGKRRARDPHGQNKMTHALRELRQVLQTIDFSAPRAAGGSGDAPVQCTARPVQCAARPQRSGSRQKPTAESLQTDQATCTKGRRSDQPGLEKRKGLAPRRRRQGKPLSKFHENGGLD